VQRIGDVGVQAVGGGRVGEHLLGGVVLTGGRGRGERRRREVGMRRRLKVWRRAASAGVKRGNAVTILRGGEQGENSPR